MFCRILIYNPKNKVSEAPKALLSVFDFISSNVLIMVRPNFGAKFLSGDLLTESIFSTWTFTSLTEDVVHVSSNRSHKKHHRSEDDDGMDRADDLVVERTTSWYCRGKTHFLELGSQYLVPKKCSSEHSARLVF